MMTDIQSILEDLQNRAKDVAENVDIDTKVEDAKQMAGKIKDRIAEDPQAKAAAIGGGALLALLMATKGGRKTLGTVAKTGMVAGLGAMAYNAWKTRSDGEGEDFPDDAAQDNDFERALVETMAMAASADGAIDDAERDAIEAALTQAGADPHALSSNLSTDQMIDKIVSYASSPNQAHRLYTSACVGCQDASAGESSFLLALADRLAIHPRTADEIRTQAS